MIQFFEYNSMMPDLFSTKENNFEDKLNSLNMRRKVTKKKRRNYSFSIKIEQFSPY